MKKTILLICTSFLILGGIVFAQGINNNKNNMTNKNYEKLWASVEQKEKEDLPKSAIESVNKILQKAISEKNTPQAIKALIYKSKFETEINSNDATDIFSGLDSLLNSTKNIEDKTLLNSLLAELYNNYYEANLSNIRERTNLNNYIPEDINEWSANIFINKIIEHLNESVKNEKALLETNLNKYQEIIVLNKDSERIFPTMYDFLLNRAINVSQSMYATNEATSLFNKSLEKLNYTIGDLALPTLEFIKLQFSNTNNLAPLFYTSQLLKSLEKRHLKEAIVFTELKRNEYLSQTFSAYKNQYALSFLENLLDQYSSYDFSVEIINNIINQLNDTANYEGDKLNKIYTLLTNGIKEHPNYDRINLLKEKLANLEQSEMSLQGKETYHPSSEKLFTIKYKNINRVLLSVTDKDNSIVWHKDLTFSPQTTYLTDNANPLTLDISKEGVYTIKFTYINTKNQSATDSLTFRVSKLASFSRSIGNNKYEIYVVDSKNGTPVSDVKINFFTQNWQNRQNTYSPLDYITYTDKNGFAQYSNANSDKNQYNLYYTLSKGDDNVKNYISIYSYFRNEQPSLDNNLIRIFTDRNIYRPGQTVYFKTVASINDNLTNTQTPIVNKKYTIKLFDANYQEVSQQTLTTNEFGSFAGEFIIPKGRLTGNYTLRVENQQIWFNVEEYKRPTFDITFDPVVQTYTFGDSVNITGQVKSFSGIELQNLNVNFSISKNPIYRFWEFGYKQIDNFDEGFVKTDNNGKFKITFKIPTENNDRYSRIWMPNVYNYKISASVTNINGETQWGYKDFNAGNVSMMITCDLPEKIEKSSNLDFDIKAENLSNQSIDAKGTYTVYSVLENDSIDTKVLSGNFLTGNQKELQSKILKLNSGRYTLQLETKDQQNRLIKTNSFFTLYSYNDNKPPFYTNDWIITKNDVFDERTPAEIIFGLSSKNITVLYELIKENNILSRQQLKISDENIHLNIPYKEEYGEGIVASFTYIIDGVSYIKTINITKKTETKALTIQWKTFRDKVRPGEKEEWSMIINRTDGNPAFAEVLASMYDASLDKLYTKDIWSSLDTYRPSIWGNTMSYTNIFNDQTIGGLIPGNNYKIPELSWSNFNWFDFNFPYQSSFTSLRYARSSSYLVQSQAVLADVSPASEKSNLLSKNATLGKQQLTSAIPHVSTQMEEQKGQSQIRSNFAETAFFYPQIKTDKEGKAIISFTVPESNTTWNFRTLAYNKIFDTGRLDTTIISQKELMVTPNLPRFFRQGDKASIATTISNLSDKTTDGKVHLEFFDPVTNKVADIKIENQYQNFNLQKGASTDAAWLFTVPDSIDVLGCRIIAESTLFSDGEQQAIAVLPNKILITESMPININGSQNKNFHFENLLHNASNTSSNYRVTFEYANNPAWYAIQALPTLNNPRDNNAIDNFASYYVNTLGISITKEYPKVTSVIKAWIAQNGTSKTLISQLQKNEELKTVLLQETPWVLEAKNETDQMERLSLLFNLNNTNLQNSLALEQLANLQNSDGGWSWFKGMYSDRNITQYILYGFSELVNLGAVEYGEKGKMMQMAAIKYIDDQIIKDYKDLIEGNNKKNITTIPRSALEYLFVRSNYRDIPISQEARQAERFYTSVVEKNWTKLDLYERALLIVLAKINGNNKLADKIIASLREKATINEQQGMFWANNNSTAFISQSAVSVQTFMINSFKEYGAPTHELDLMKQWLLSQKQTQQWESTDATINAIYALLSTGTNWFNTEGNVKITVNNNPITTYADLGTGYIQKVWVNDQVSNQLGNINIDRTGDGPAWGAMYWQYYENLSKVKAEKGDLNIDKKLFIEKQNTLYPITTETKLKIGDKVTVRLTVKADRDMDFVMLKDQRASCFEPINILSGTNYNNGVSFYQTTLDASTNYYFNSLPKGTYVFEYSVYINRAGKYANGITVLQSMYAPQFVSHSEGITIEVAL